MKIGIIGLGFVGEAMYNSFKQLDNINISVYDKYKYGCGIGKFEDIIDSELLFLALPTTYNTKEEKYDKEGIYETFEKLSNNNFNGVIILKSTVEPGTIDNLSDLYNIKNIVHNPEFLTARTAARDFHYQKHIVLGKGKYCSLNNYNKVIHFYDTYYNKDKNIIISSCDAIEAESMKIFCNSFYAVKVQFFNEIYLLCNKLNISYNNVISLMLKNGWISPNHIQVPGPDGNLSYGGACFPKDTNALKSVLLNYNLPAAVITATINERESMRDDNDNVI